MDTISQIKHKLSIVDIVGSYVDLKKSGKNYKGLCPFHNEKTSSFMVSPDIGIYKCFGCNESGDIFAFIQKIEGLTFHEAKKKLADKAGVDISGESQDYKSHDEKSKLYAINDLSAKIYNKVLLTHSAGKDGLDYFLNTRKLTKELISQFQLGYAPEEWDFLYKALRSRKYSDVDMSRAGVTVKRTSGNGYIDKFRHRVLFPLIGIDSQVLGFIGRALTPDQQPKYLNTAETEIFKKSNFVYGLHLAKMHMRKEGALVVEGPMDVISCVKIGIHNVVAPLGTALTEQHLAAISRYTKDITFCFDSDSAGMTAARKAITLAEDMDFTIKCIIIPSGYKDLDELVQKDPDNAFTIIRNTILYYDYVITTLAKSMDTASPYGKDAALDAMRSYFVNIKSKVLIDHYAQIISQVLDVSVSIVLERLQSPNVAKKSSLIEPAALQPSPGMSNTEKLFIALLFQADISIARDFVYDVPSEVFVNIDLRTIYNEIALYLKQNSEATTLKSLVTTLSADLTKLVTELMLWNFNIDVSDPQAVVTELKKTSSRLKLEYTKRQLVVLGKSVKLAEAQKDVEQLSKLTVKMQELSKQLT